MFSSLEEYKKESYDDSERQMLQAMNQWLGDSEAKCRQKWQAAMTDILHQAAAVQQQAKQAGKSLPCRYLTCSLLYSSIYLEKPQVRVEFFGDEAWYSHAPWLTASIDVSELLVHWTPFVQQALAREGWIARYYSAAAIQRLFPKTIEKVVYLLTRHWHYWARELLLQGKLAELERPENFELSLGQYRGWQEPLYRTVPVQDIFLHGAKSLVAVDFRRCIYRGREIRQEDLTEARFWECRWETVQLEQVNLTDALFVGCRFYHVTFTDCYLAAVRFEDCQFYNCTFTGCNANPESKALPLVRLYPGARWQQCQWKKCVFDRCDLQWARFSDDWQDEVTLRECQLEQAGFIQVEQEAEDD